jgi:hypothetical protein
MIVSFVKLLDADSQYIRWHLHDKLWRGDNKDLLLPSSLNCLVEEESSIAAKSISFHISKHPIEDASVLEKIHNEDMEEGRYRSIIGEVYICDLLLQYFPEGYPNKIYYKYVHDT